MTLMSLPSETERRQSRLRRQPFALDELLYQLIANSDKPMGAYALTRNLLDDGYQVVPNQIYRVLRRLVSAGRIRKIATLSAFIAVTSVRHELACICSGCNLVTLINIPSMDQKLRIITNKSPFKAKEYITEAVGLCSKCSSKEKQGC